jgi:hypothetical protein
MTSFVYNPLSHKFDLTNITVLPPGTVGSLTGDTGGAIAPDGSGNINLLGNPSMLAAGNGGTNTISFSNLRNASRYVVGADGLSEYTTIQSAINQAIIDGADVNNPAVVFINPALYIENLILQPYVSLASLAGNVQIQGAAATSAPGDINIYNIIFVSNGISSSFTTTNTGFLTFYNCVISNSSTGIGLENTLGADVTCYQCTINSSGGAAFSSDDSNINLYDCIVTSVAANAISGNSGILFSSVIMTGFMTMADIAVLAILNSQIYSGSNPCISIGATNQCTASCSVLYSTDASTFFVTGTGDFGFNAISFQGGTATIVDPGLTITGYSTCVENISISNGDTFDADGQLLIGSSSGPIINTLSGVGGISILNGPGSITISGAGGSISWNNVAGTSQAMVAENAYVPNNAGLVTLTLPSLAAFGTVLSVVGSGAGGWIIAQNGGQNIQIGAFSSTVGVGGSVASSNQYDSINLVCTVANLTWVTYGAPQGSLIII